MLEMTKSLRNGLELAEISANTSFDTLKLR